MTPDTPTTATVAMRELKKLLPSPQGIGLLKMMRDRTQSDSDNADLTGTDDALQIWDEWRVLNAAADMFDIVAAVNATDAGEKADATS